ncbi:MAG: helix-turn-helix domain-containing protein [Methanoculleus sp.]
MNTSKKPSLQPKYSEAFKLKILDDIKSRRYTITEVSLLYGMCRKTVYKWIHKYGQSEIITRRIRVEPTGEVRMDKKVMEENQRLKDALAALTLENMCLRAELEVLGENKEELKKKRQFSSASFEPKK